MQPVLEPCNLVGVALCHIVVGPHPYAPARPSLAVTLLGSIGGDLIGQRVNSGHDAVLAQVALAVLCPAVLECSGVLRVIVELIPPERY